MRRVEGNSYQKGENPLDGKEKPQYSRLPPFPTSRESSDQKGILWMEKATVASFWSLWFMALREQVASTWEGYEGKAVSLGEIGTFQLKTKKWKKVQ